MFHRKPTEVFLLASVLLAGCGTLFGIDDPERPEPPSGAASGKGGTSGGGTSGGGAGGTVEPPGGSGMAGDGGEVGTGGSSGNATGGGGTAGGGAAGSSGTGGKGGGGDGDEFPSERDPCPTPGALACVGPARNGRLMCEGGVWTRADDCVDEGNSGPKRNCDRRSGACALVDDYCLNETPTSQYTSCPMGGTVAESCGPDLVSMTREYCELGCNNATQKCAEASGDELIVDHVPATQGDFVFWPTPVIPVCFRDEGAEFDSKRAAIRDEIDSTWGRYSSVAFSGWNGCSSSPPGLAEARILFVDDCVGELARIPRYGYPGPGAKLELAICESYVDGNDVAQIADEAMLRFVARHLFGHVLGYVHEPWDFMRPLLIPSMIPELVFDGSTIDALQQIYGGKPSGSLVNARGRCVGWSPEGLIGTHVCDGSAETRWQALEGRLEADGRTGCLHATVYGATSLVPCATTPEFVWETNDVQWRGNAGRCVTKSAATSGPSLVLETCRALGDADQTWSFDFYDGRRVRIRRADEQCVHIPEAFGEPLPLPELAPCDGARDELEITRTAQLGLSGYCMTERYNSAYQVQLAPCQATQAQSFYLSGPLGHDVRTALTLRSSGDLDAAAVDGIPTAAQIFDYYF